MCFQHPFGPSMAGNLAQMRDMQKATVEQFARSCGMPYVMAAPEGAEPKEKTRPNPSEDEQCTD